MVRNEKYSASGRRDDVRQPHNKPQFLSKYVLKKVKDLYAKKKKKIVNFNPLP